MLRAFLVEEKKKKKTQKGTTFSLDLKSMELGGGRSSKPHEVKPNEITRALLSNPSVTTSSKPGLLQNIT